VGLNGSVMWETRFWNQNKGTENSAEENGRDKRKRFSCKGKNNGKAQLWSFVNDNFFLYSIKNKAIFIPRQCNNNNNIY
jgi:hypothetical protein